MVFQDGFIEHIGRMVGIANMLNDIPNVEWPEARMAVWMWLKRLEDDSKQLSSNQSVMQEKIENKFTKDLYEAHSKIRNITSRLERHQEENQKQLIEVRIELAKQSLKMGAITGGISGFVSIALVEVFKHFLSHPLTASVLGNVARLMF